MKEIEIDRDYLLQIYNEFKKGVDKENASIEKEIAEFLAKDICDDLQRAYDRIINSWYASYSPIIYKRQNTLQNAMTLSLSGSEIIIEMNSDALSGHKAYAKALEKAIEKAIPDATTIATKRNLTQLGKNANVKDFMSQYPELASTSELDSRVRGGITSFINKNKISSEYQEQIAELFRIGNIIKKINESYSSKSGLFKAKEYETLDEMLAARQRQADVLAYHDRLVERFNKNNTPDNLGGHQVATRNYFTKKNSELIPGFNTSVTEEVSQKALIGDIKTSLEAGGEGIATAFVAAAKSIGAGCNYS